MTFLLLSSNGARFMELERPVPELRIPITRPCSIFKPKEPISMTRYEYRVFRPVDQSTYVEDERGRR